MSIKILKHFHTNVASNIIYTFPSAGTVTAGIAGGFEAVTEEYAFRSDVTDKSWSEGGFLVGDNYISPRIIPVAGIVQGPSKAETIIEINKMRHSCYQANLWNTPRYLEITQYPSQFYNIAGIKSFTVDWITDRAAEVNVDFVLTDPFRYAKYEYVINSNYPFVTFTTVPYTWQLAIGTDLAPIQIPRFLVTVVAGRLAEFSIQAGNLARRPNNTRAGLKLTGMDIASDAEFNTIVINSSNGNITLQPEATADTPAGTNIAINCISKLAYGDFPWLYPGTNDLIFNGKAIPLPGHNVADMRLKVTLKLRERYL